MIALPKTDNTLLLRTDFHSDEAWNSLCARVTAMVGEFRAYVTPLSDVAFVDASVDVVIRAATGHQTVFIADAHAHACDRRYQWR
jgi:hypothetical protein